MATYLNVPGESQTRALVEFPPSSHRRRLGIVTALVTLSLLGGALSASALAAGSRLPRVGVAAGTRFAVGNRPAALRATVRRTVRTRMPATQQAELAASDGAPGDQFGGGNNDVVAIFGSTAVIGAPGKNSHTGAAYVFVRSGSTWKQLAELTASDAAGGDNFGYAVSIYGSTIVVGEPSQNFGTGAVYVFTGSGSTWSQRAELTASDGSRGSGFGRSVALYGSALLVGADGSNEAYVFTGSGSSWSEPAVLVSPLGVRNGDGFGWSVALHNSTALIGAPSTNSGTGTAYIYGRTSTGAWTKRAALTASDGTSGDELGYSAGLTGSSALVGAVFAHATGAAYVFTHTATGWSEQTELRASDGAGGDNFGTSVSIYYFGQAAATGAVVGANGKNSSAGAAYAFTSTGSGWSQLGKLKASDGAPGDSLGTSVALYGRTAIVGAPGHDSSTGAAYEF